MIQVSLEHVQLEAVVAALSSYRNELIAAMRVNRRSDAQRVEDQRTMDAVDSAFDTCQEALRSDEDRRHYEAAVRDSKKVRG